MKSAVIFDITRNSFVDGPGIRTTVFFKGCNLKCAWCHNPESQIFHPQMMFYKDKCINCGKCIEKCPNNCTSCNLCGKCEIYCPVEARKVCGKEYTVDEVYAEIAKDKDFFDISGGGVTFSGGECMLQLDFLKEILKKCKENGIHTAVDTAGNVSPESFKSILSYTDMFLYDVKIMDSQKHKEYTGVNNDLILKNLADFLKTGLRIWIRIPVIAGINDTLDEMYAIRDFFDKNGHPEKIELLPYHSMGENKYRALGMKPRIFSAPETQQIQELKSVFGNIQ